MDAADHWDSRLRRWWRHHQRDENEAGSGADLELELAQANFLRDPTSDFLGRRGEGIVGGAKTRPARAWYHLVREPGKRLRLKYLQLRLRSRGWPFKGMSSKLPERPGRQPGFRLSGGWPYYIGGAAAAALLVGLVYWVSLPPVAYAVYVDGRQVALVKDPSEVDRLLQQVGQQMEEEGWQAATYNNRVELARTRAEETELTSSRALLAALDQVLGWKVRGYALVVDGQTVGILKDKTTAEEVLAGVKEYYTAGKEGEIEDVAFAEQVEILARTVAPGQIAEAGSVKKMLLYGRESKETYVVKEGDSLWTIARARDLTVEELAAANPQLEALDKLSLGQEINLVQLNPVVHVVVTSEVTREESIPYLTRVKDDPDLYRGQEKVKQPGQEGRKITRYRLVENNGIVTEKELLEEKVLQEPVTKIVARGARQTVSIASRGSGTGVLAWPLSGRINSGYGYRGKEFHTGIDIDGSVGDPVRAAAGGKVIAAARLGGYGLQVIVDHGNGLATRYAHLSATRVSVGDEVSKGQVIGAVGTSGRTTGPHLHFEVLVNGSPTNPLHYLR